MSLRRDGKRKRGFRTSSNLKKSNLEINNFFINLNIKNRFFLKRKKVIKIFLNIYQKKVRTYLKNPQRNFKD